MRNGSQIRVENIVDTDDVQRMHQEIQTRKPNHKVLTVVHDYPWHIFSVDADFYVDPPLRDLESFVEELSFGTIQKRSSKQVTVNALGN